MSRLKRSAPYIISLTLLALLVAHVPFFASSEVEAPPAAYRALYDQYVGPSVDKVYQAGQAGLSGWTGGLTASGGGGGAKSGDVWGAACDRCMVNPEICGKFGSHNIDLSRAFEGTGGRVQRVLKKAMVGEPIKMGAIGGSISRGHGCNCHPWHEQVSEWWNATFPNDDNFYASGAVGARGSNYYQFCHHQHLPQDADLILVEMSVNDIFMNVEAQNTFETLLRAILSYPSHPAVIVLQTFQIQQQLATGGDVHVSTCQYYDVPVIGIRNWMLPKLLADYSAADQWFLWQDGKDKLHPLGPGHTAMAEMIQIYLEQQICYIKNERPYVAPSSDPLVPQTHQFANIDSIPRIRLTQTLLADNTTPDIVSSCASVDSEKTPLTPVADQTHGWEFWLQPPQMEKKYWRSVEVGSVVTFDMELAAGKINFYYLRSSKMNLGNLKCWIDDDKSKVEIMEGSWERAESIGQQKELVFDGRPLPEGKHQLHCENIGDPTNAENTTFLIIGLFTV